jgi:two-component system chemotaxis sensor kinase CheA
LTLAIVQALIVKSAGDCYVIPQSSIVEIVRLQGAEACAVLDASRGVANYCYRQRLLPIVPLRSVLELETSACDSTLEDLILVVLKVRDRQFGLVVDRIVDTQEVVIKPLWQPLRAITVYAGATQLGDGTVALILDPVGLAGRAGLVLGRQEARPDNVERLSEADEGPAACVTRLETGERFALPTRGLKRIEKLMRARIKRLDGREMLEYEGEIIRAIDIAALYRRESPPAEVEAAESMDETASTMHVAFYASGGKTTALIVGPTVDIVRHSWELRGKAHRPYVQFTTMIDDHLVELLDVDGMIRSVEPEWTGGDTAASGGSVGDD